MALKKIVIQSKKPSLSIDYAAALNSEQLDVVTKGDGYSLVLAGAGSGKTRTVTYRVAYLVEQGIDPQSILLLTFTNKAAREMLGRVETLLGGAGRGVWGGTFHHVANRLLRPIAQDLGFNNNFTILDSQDSQDLLTGVLREMGVAKGDKKRPTSAVLREMISYGHNAELPMSAVLEKKHPRWLPDRSFFEQAAKRYAEKKLATNSLDFDDLLGQLLKWLKQSDDHRLKLASRFKYVLVDEYQDTNKLQADLADQLSSVHKNLLVVGDDAQSIYSFRAADVNNILSFPNNHPDTKLFRLETNYRSRPEILSLANEVINQNKQQFVKRLRTLREEGDKPLVIPALSSVQEAEVVSTLIEKFLKEGHSLKDCAVLFRAAFHSQPLEMELTRRNIPYDYRGGVRFFERAHIKDVLAFLKVLHNPKEEIAWGRILNLQSGIGPAAAKKVLAEVTPASGLEIILAQSMPLSKQAAAGWNNLRSLLVELAKRITEPPEKLLAAVRGDWYDPYLEVQYPDFKERQDDLDQLSGFAAQYRSVESFLAEVTLQEGFSGRTRAEDDQDTLVLSTIHQAKGLEWPVVFVINLVEGAFPIQRAISEAGGLAEERRLFYVAITRAADQLYLSYPLTGSGNRFYLNSVSSFLRDIPDDLVDRAEVTDSYAGTFGNGQLNDGAVRYEAEDNHKSYLPDI